MFHPYKNRQVNMTKPVLVYKNLHNGKFSLKQNNLVVGHVDCVTLKQVCFIVNERNRQRVIRERQKNVHAFVKGYVVDFIEQDVKEDSVFITYNPYKFDNFVFAKSHDKAILTHNETLHCHALNGLFVKRG